MELRKLSRDFTICKAKEISAVDFTKDFVFVSKTDDELSLVCETKDVPSDTIDREDGWKALKIQGNLNFGLIGIIAKISGILADNKISVFVISTYNTDYILIKNVNYDKSVELLSANDYDLID